MNPDNTNISVELIDKSKVPSFKYNPKTFNDDCIFHLKKIVDKMLEKLENDSSNGKYGVYYSNPHSEEDCLQHFFVRIDDRVYICGVLKISVSWEQCAYDRSAGQRIEKYDYIAFNKTIGFIKYKNIPNIYRNLLFDDIYHEISPFIFYKSKNDLHVVNSRELIDSNNFENCYMVFVESKSNDKGYSLVIYCDNELIANISTPDVMRYSALFGLLFYMNNRKLFVFDLLTCENKEFGSLDMVDKSYFVHKAIKAYKSVKLTNNGDVFESAFIYVENWKQSFNASSNKPKFNFYLSFDDLPLIYSYGKNTIAGIDYIDGEPYYVLPFDYDNLFLIIKKLIKKGNNYMYGNYSIANYISSLPYVDRESGFYNLACIAKEYGCRLLGIDNVYGHERNAGELFLASFINEELNKTFNEIERLVKNNYADNPFSARWKNEFKLYNMVKLIFPDTIYQYKAEWLDGLSLDIMVPSINLAFEYQGKQHYEEIDFFKSNETLLERKERDFKKKDICAKNNVYLIEWKYSTEVTFTNIKQVLQDEIGLEIDLTSVKTAFNDKEINLQELTKTSFIDRRHLDEKEVNQIKSRAVVRFDRNGFYIDEYSSQLEASSISGAKEEEIDKACRAYKNYYLAGGYQWRYKSDCFEEDIGRYIFDCYSLVYLEVYQFSNEGLLIRKHPSLYEASKKTKIPQENIYDALRGLIPTAGGFAWKFIFPKNE